MRNGWGVPVEESNIEVPDTLKAIDAAASIVNDFTKVQSSVNTMLNRELAAKDSTIYELTNRIDTLERENHKLSLELSTKTKDVSIGARYTPSSQAPIEYPNDTSYSPFNFENRVVASKETVTSVDYGIEETINPMEVFVLFLQELNVLDLFIQAQAVEFEELREYSPSDYLAVGLTGDEDEVPLGWGEANGRWKTLVRENSLNDYIHNASY